MKQKKAQLSTTTSIIIAITALIIIVLIFGPKITDLFAGTFGSLGVGETECEKRGGLCIDPQKSCDQGYQEATELSCTEGKKCCVELT